MKKLLFLLLVFFLNINSFAGTCSSISYTSSTANSTLTSTKYNTDNSTVYNFVNAYDAGCITSNTLENDALDTSVATGFAAPLNGVFDGCKVTKATAATLSIGNCIASVNNNWIKTATTTTVAWTDLDTGSETASTYYYVYIDSTSSGTTLTPVISATAPGTDGLNSSDRVLARFYNDGSSDIIDQVSQWHVNKFESDFIRFRYTDTAAQSIPNAAITIVTHATKDYDSHNIFNTSDGKATVPRDGRYHCDAGAYFTTPPAETWQAGETGRIYLYVNETQKSMALNAFENSSTNFMGLPSIGDTYDLSSGDYITARVYQDSDDALALISTGAAVYISCHSVD